MAIICEKYGLIYIQVPGTGYSVVSEILREQFMGKELGRKHCDIPELVATGLLTEQQLEEFVVVANVRNPADRIVTYFQRLKGPWTEKYLRWAERDLQRKHSLGEIPLELYKQRIESLEKVASRKRRRARIVQNLGFNTWLQATIFRWFIRTFSRSTVSQEYFFPMLHGVDVVLKQERLEEAFNELLLLLGIKDQVSLPRKNLTAGKEPYATYYNWLSRWSIEKLCSDEMELFGYQFGGVDRGGSIVHLTNDLQHKQAK